MMTLLPNPKNYLSSWKFLASPKVFDLIAYAFEHEYVVHTHKGTYIVCGPKVPIAQCAQLEYAAAIAAAMALFSAPTGALSLRQAGESLAPGLATPLGERP